MTQSDRHETGVQQTVEIHYRNNGVSRAVEVPRSVGILHDYFGVVVATANLPVVLLVFLLVVETLNYAYILILPISIAVTMAILYHIVGVLIDKSGDVNE